MCGIFGFSSIDDERNHELAKRMMYSLRHRGPENTNYEILSDYVMGHTLLSFVKIGHNQQPLLDSNKETMVVFNGEIYNYEEIYSHLIKKGVTFKHRTDTEVILSLYKCYGTDFIEYIKGMFAIAIYDKQQDRIVLARDPLGKKPLYYYAEKNVTVFASELTSILLHPNIQNKLNLKAIQQYLIYNSVPAPYSMYHNIKKVNPGSIVIICKDCTKEKKYWRYPIFHGSAFNHVNDDEIYEILHHSFSDAVKIRLNNMGGKVGIFLSGGIDSSLVAKYAKSLATTKVMSFSVGFEDNSYDESTYFEDVSSVLELKQNTLYLTAKDIAKVIMKKYELLDEPLADASLAAMIPLAEFAKIKVKAVLSGDGADELFFGYRFFEVIKLLNLLDKFIKQKSAKYLKKIIDFFPANHKNLGLGYALSLLARSINEPLYRKYYETTSAYSINEFSKFMNSDVLHEMKKYNPYENLENELLDYNTKDIMEISQLSIISHFLRMTILTKVDRSCMLSGLEVRSPFLDIDFIKLCQRIPIDFKIKKKNTKLILKKFAKQVLPDRIVSRQKQGFRVPIARILCHELRSFCLETLSKESIQNCGIFNYNEINKILKQHFEHQFNHQKKIWSLLCFHIWYKKNGGTI